LIDHFTSRISLSRAIGKQKGKGKILQGEYELTPYQQKALDVSMDVLERVFKNRHPIDSHDYLFSTRPWNAPGRQLREVEWNEMLNP
jgi:hypothetical protein